MIVFAKIGKLPVPFLSKLKNLETFVQHDRRPNFGSKKTRSKGHISIPYSVGRICQTREPENSRTNRKFPVVLKRFSGAKHAATDKSKNN